MSPTKPSCVADRRGHRPRRLTLALAGALALLGAPALAQQPAHDGLLEKLRDKGVLTQDEYEEIKREREAEQAQHEREQTRKEARKTASDAEEKQKAAAKDDGLRGVKIKVGGYIEAASIYRSRNETADVGSNYNTGIPVQSNPNHEMSEFRESARQSRLTLLATGNPDDKTALAGYFETDFLGAGVTSNSVESNSYTPRLRQAYATYDRSDWGFEFLGGQAWSLTTMNKLGINPRQENIPLTIDAQYTVGFNWTRNAQLRVVKSYDNGLTLGFSAESPQAIVIGTSPAGTVFNNPGGSLLNSTTTYSTDIAPDLVLKAALDPGWGHYELYGLMRFFRDRTSNENSTTTGGGIGASALLPIVHGKLDFQASVLAGTGIGRYGSAQLPDVTFRPDGKLVTIPGVDALLGVVGHPNEKWDYYVYGGMERAGSTAYAGTKFGYGDNPLVDTKDCFYGGIFANCSNATTANVWQAQLGAWWKFYQGSYGYMELGASYSYIRRTLFSGNAGSPSTDDNIVMTSFRYYPFQ